MSGGPTSEVGRAAVRPLLTATIVGWCLFSLLAAVHGDRPRTLAVDVATALLTLLAREVIARRPAWSRVAVHGALVVNLVALVVTSWLAGGAAGVGWTLLPAVPLFAAHVEGRRVGIIWCAITVLGCVLATSVDLSELDAPPSVAHHVVAGVWLIVICTTFAVMARAEVEAQLSRVEAGAKARSDLVAAISHDVRTPLHAVLGITTVLAETELEPDQRDLVERLAGTGKSLQRIVDDVLDTAQLEAGRFTIVPRPIDLLEVLEDVIDLHAPDALAKGLSLTLAPRGSDAFRVVGDDARLMQVLSNLLANAVKYTPSGAITVRAQAIVEGERSQIEIAVEDTGPGIPSDRVDRLFSRFERLDAAAARGRGGTGLGLALSWDLARLMGGSLTLDRRHETGARFVLSLDLPVSREPVRDELGGVVLVLESSPARAEATRALVASFSAFATTVVPRLDDALAALREGRSPDVVIVHAGVPDLIGAERAIAAALRGRVPIVLAREPTGATVDKRVVATFSGTTLLPLRRSRLARLLDEGMRSGTFPALTHGTALVVDDDATNRKILARVVSHRGWTVVSAETAHEALTRLRERKFELVLCDLDMPDVDGVTLLESAKKEGIRASFVVVTASQRPEDRERCLAAGFDAYLRKPLHLGEIDALLARRGTSALLPPAEGPARTTATSDRVHHEGAVERPSAPQGLVDEARWEQGRALMAEEHDDVVREHFEAARAHLSAIDAHPEDVARVEHHAHTLASGALGLGLSALGHGAQALEQAARSLSAEARRAEARRLRELLEATREAVRDPRRGAAAPSDRGPIIEMRVVGRLGRDVLAQRIAAVVRNAPSGPLTVLGDLTRMTEYEPGVPDDLADWLLANRERLVGFAFVSQESMLRAAAAMRAESTGLPIAAFDDVTSARAWLDLQLAKRAGS